MSRPRYDVLRSRLEAFTRFLRKVEEGDTRAVHRTRVAARRLRELVPVLQLDADASRRLMRGLRDVTRELGKLREPDVLGVLMDARRRDLTGPAARALRLVLDDVQATRQELKERERHHHVGRRLRRVAKRLEKAAARLGEERGRIDRRWVWAVDARVARRAAALQRAIDDAGAVYLAERIHQVRKSVKKLRYALELQHQVEGSAAAADLKRLERWQELLGSLQDRQMIIDRIRHVQAQEDGPGARSTRGLDSVLLDLENECRRLHGRYLRGRSELLDLCERLVDSSARGRTSRSLRAAAGADAP